MLPRSGISVDGRDFLGCLKASWGHPYVDPAGDPCSFEDWAEHRRRNRPIEIVIRGHLYRIVFVGIWHPDGTPPMAWHAEAASFSWLLVAATTCEAAAFAACEAHASDRPKSYGKRAA